MNKMEWLKPSPTLAETFAAAVPEHPAVTRRKMFGNPAAFAAGNMFACVFQNGVYVRLSSAEIDKLVREEAAFHLEPMGRTMRGYVSVPASAVEAPEVLRGWMERSLAFALTLPAKEPKAKKPRSSK